MKALNKFIFPAWFIRLSNGKFLMFETLFLYMVLAAGLAAIRIVHEGKEGITGLQFVDLLFFSPFILGIAFQIYKYYAPKISVLSLPDSYWKTQLAILSNPQYKMGMLTATEEEKLRFLKKRWQKEYGISWNETRLAKTQKFIPWLLVIVPLVLVWIFS